MRVNIEFGPFMAARREQKNMTQKELADHVGISVGQLSRIETGSRMPPRDYEKIKKIALKLGENPSLFLELARFEWVPVTK